MLEHTPASHNVMLTGRHGVGKSEVLTEFFAQKGMRVVSLFLGQMSDPGDLIGLPDRSGEVTVFRPPYWFPVDGQPIVLFLDELNRARPEVLQTIMDLALNRRLAGRDLPEGSRVIAAVNEGEEYQLTDLDPALVSRFNVFRFEPTVAEWLLWARSNDVDYRVVGFIRENGTWLDGDPNMAEGSDTGMDKTPDRRAWKRVSDVIKGRPTLSDSDLKLISSIVGVKAAKLFVVKMAQAKPADVRALLHDFDAEVDDFANYQPHDFEIISEDIYQYLTVTSFAAAEGTAVAGNVRKYVKFLEDSGRRESLASFANMFQQIKYEQAAEFMVRNCPDVAMKLLSYTSRIR